MPVMSERFMARLTDLVKGCFPVRPGETLDEWAERAIAADLSASQRAMLAAYMGMVSDEFDAERRAKKRAWVAVARLQFMPGNRQPCHACGKFRDITHAHHVVPLSAQFDRGFSVPDHEAVWLCPNHHTILHLLIPPERETALEKLGARAAESLLEISKDELTLLLELVTRSGRGPR